jgi:predicted amidohydrolase
MPENRRGFLKTLAAGAASGALWAGVEADYLPAAGKEGRARRIPVALIQCDSPAGQVERNLDNMERLGEKAAKSGARWIMFHELTVCDYADKPESVAELVPQGVSTRRMAKLAQRLRVICAFGLAEKHRDRIYDSQVFVGPKGYFYHYRKTWLWLEPKDGGYRNEWARYDPGAGPEIFTVDGLRATCFICADGDSERCIERAAALKPQVVFFPNNRASLPPFEAFGKIARRIGAPMLVANRVGRSVVYDTKGGCVVFSAQGEVLAKANREGREEILHYELELPA